MENTKDCNNFQQQDCGVSLTDDISIIHTLEQSYKELESQRDEQIAELQRQYDNLFIDYKKALDLSSQKDLEIIRLQLFEKHQCFPPGHFYSPIVAYEDIEDVISRQNIAMAQPFIPSVDLNLKGQLELLNTFKSFYSNVSFPDDETLGNRYYYKNDFYSYGDAISLYCMLRHLKPKKVIEVGSGFTSALLLDINEEHFDSQIELNFIEPYPDRLYSLMKPSDKQSAKTIVDKVQNVNLAFFEELRENDILLIDSSHVAKSGSDLNYILFEILPSLKRACISIFMIFFSHLKCREVGYIRV